MRKKCSTWFIGWYSVILFVFLFYMFLETGQIVHDDSTIKNPKYSSQKSVTDSRKGSAMYELKLCELAS